MRASRHTCVPATGEHRQDVLWQEEIDRKIEEIEYPTGGHRIGDGNSIAPLRPRHVGLTSAEEHAMWLQDISHWQGEYRSALADLERVQALVTENRDVLDEHAEALAAMIADHDAMTEKYDTLKAKHLRARRAHDQAAVHHHKVMHRVRRIANEIRETFGPKGDSVP